jgi:hypothetical protein
VPLPRAEARGDQARQRTEEARAWFAAGNGLRGCSTLRAREIVERLYLHGAVTVWMGEAAEISGKQVAWNMVVELPIEPDRRAAIFDDLRQMRSREQAKELVDTRQRFEAVIFDGSVE